MRAVGLKVLKNKLSEYVRLAAGGETVLVTDRDRVVAEIVPPRAGRGEWVADAQLAALIREGAVADFTLWFGPLPLRWTAVHSEVSAQHGFTDTQQRGPLASWRHTHRFEALDGRDAEALVVACSVPYLLLKSYL